MAGLRSVVNDYGAAMVCALAVGACWAPIWGARETLALGGGAGLIAYLLLLALLGLPWLWFELSVGSCFHCGLTEMWRRTARRWEWLGWWSALLALALALVVLAVASTSSMQALRGLGMLVSGSYDVSRPSIETASPVPQGPAVALCIAGLVGVVWLLNAGVAQAMRWLLMVSGIGAIAALVALGCSLGLAVVRGSLVSGLGVDFSTWLNPQLWLAAGGWALLNVLPAFGIYAVLISRRQRMVDTGGASILLFLAVAFGGLLSALLTCIPDGLANGRLPTIAHDFPLLLEPFRGVLGAPSGLAVVAIAASCLAWAAWAAVVAVLLFAVVGDAGQRAGTATQSGFPMHFALLVGACILVISDQGLWWMQIVVMMIALVVLPILLGVSAWGLRRARSLPGLVDHARAHSSIGIQAVMQPWLLIIVPLGVLGMAAGVVHVAIEYLINDWYVSVELIAVGSAFVLIGGAALSGRWIAAMVRIEPARLPGYVAVAMGGGLAVLIAAIVAMGINSAERRYLRTGFATAVEAQAENMATQSRGDEQALLRLARAAWAAGDRELAWHSLTLWTATSPPEQVTAAAGWIGELVVEADTALRSEPKDFETALAVLGLLRSLAANEALNLVQDVWRRQVELEHLGDLYAAGDALADVIGRNGRVNVVSVRQAEIDWRVFREGASGPRDLMLWTYAPEPIGSLASQLTARIQYLLSVAVDRYLPPAEAQAIAALAVATGLVPHVPDAQQIWIGETMATQQDSGPAIIFMVVVAIFGSWTLLVTLSRVVRGPAPIDPHADTLLHVDPIDVDTQAVTAEGGYTTDGATTASRSLLIDTNAETDGGGSRPVMSEL